MARPKARIVIVNFNGGEFIAAAIASALTQTVACEVLVVDNASSDGSVALIETRFPVVRLLRNSANVGFGAAASMGARAPGDYGYVAFLNSDASAQPAWIERVCGWMEDESVDIASSVVSGNAGAFFAGGTWQPFLGTALRRSTYAGKRTAWVSGCAMVVRRETFVALDGFDRAYFLYYEDVDLCLRATARGMRLGMYREALVAHPHEGRSADRLGSLEKRRVGLHSKGKLVRRFVPFWALPSALFFQCVVSPAVNGASIGEYPVLVRAFVEGFQGGAEHFA
ncbi:MAG: glycosyltransferase family 2 protein [Candidatus Eremiobacteraeota bacterium]|nr:glycosyltransferase family 2 protein [Candidatus Eremiobacteraeota bacterium]